MDLKDFSYDLPEELIAQHPLPDRQSSRLLVLNRETQSVTHRHFYDILDYLSPGDCLVMNDTKVIPARLYGVKEGSGGKIEFLLLQKLSEGRWEVILKPGRKARPGARFVFGNGALRAEILAIKDGGIREVRFEYEGIFEEVLDRLGEVPLPPYITEKLSDRERYQTVYARVDGSAAAPTAGLHFTKELLAKAEAKGVKLVYVTLHVGLGTFRPVKVEDVTTHQMHSEYYALPAEAAKTLNEVRSLGGRIISVGTTSTRVLESAAKEDGTFEAVSGWTDIFIYPGYRFRAVDALITNFHLPQSTLLMLVSALAGREFVLSAYEEAVRERYRFFSFGDCCLIY